MRVAVTGGTGTIGTEVVRQLRARGDEVVIVSRKPGDGAVTWDQLDLSGFDGVIGLAGAPLDKRWTDKYKKEIRGSRVDSTRRVVDALRAADPRPRVFVSQSAEGYYPRGDEPVSEDSPPGSGFLSETVDAWETEARKAEELGVRVVTPRTGVVLAKDGGALKKMLLPYRLGLGGPVAGGAQPFPWIHVGDAASALIFLLDTEAASGAVNLVSPEKHTNKTYTKTFGRVIKRPTVLPLPSFAIGVLFGELGSTVTQGSNPDPAKLEGLGFQYNHAGLEDALRTELG